MPHVFTVSITDEDIRLILRGLRELPYKDVAGLIVDFERVLQTPIKNATEPQVDPRQD